MGWKTSLIFGWKCSECGKERTNGVRRSRESKLSTLPHNWHQKTCSAKCARVRKTRLQSERRAKKLWGGHTPETIAAIRRAGFPNFMKGENQASK